MSPYLEFEGKIIEKAVQKACETLNVPREKLKYDVISYGSSGIFGLVGVKKARIRVTSPELPAAKDATEVQKHEPLAPAVRPDEGTAVGIPAKQLPENYSEQKAGCEEQTLSGSLTVPSQSDSDAGASKPCTPDADAGASEPCTPDNPSEVGRTALQTIVDFITDDATVSVKETPERIFFNIQGGNTAVMIGKRGQTLEAVQYIVEKVINKHNAQRIRIQIDVEGYLDSRQAKLEGLAARLAEKAKRIGKPVTIGQLNAHDRRIIHITLKEDTGVRTQSMGEGFYRKLVIFPQKRFFRRKEAAQPLPSRAVEDGEINFEEGDDE